MIGNDVREGGFRVGLVSDAKPIELPSGQVGAQLTLQLDEAHRKVPKDSTASIRPCRCSGPSTSTCSRDLQAVHRQRRNARRSRTRAVPVQFDDVFKTFDTKTRTAIQNNLQGYGNTLAGRGSALNDTIAAMPRCSATCSRWPTTCPSRHRAHALHRVAEPVHERDRPGRAGQRRAAAQRGHDVRRAGPRPQRAQADDRPDARRRCRSGTDSLARPAAVPDRLHHAGQVPGSGHRVAAHRAAGDQSGHRAGHAGARAHPAAGQGAPGRHGGAQAPGPGAGDEPGDQRADRHGRPR